MNKVEVIWFSLALLISSRAHPLDRAATLQTALQPTTAFDYALHYTAGLHGAPALADNKIDASEMVSRGDLSTWSIYQRLGIFNLTDSLVVPDTGLSVPKTLWTVIAGLRYSLQLDRNKQIGFNASFGSESDIPFHSIHETSLQGMVHYRLPSGERNAWLFLVQYSNNRPFLNNIPLPGFAFFYNRPDLNLQIVLGLPFISISYKPAEWSLRLSLFGPTAISTEVAYRLAGPVSLYATFDRGPHMWLRANRDDYAARLIYDALKGTLGVRSRLGVFSIDLAGGYEFNRRFFEATSATTRGAPQASLAASWFTEVKLACLFN